MTETDYQKGYFNGDIGEIVRKEGGNVYIRFPHKVIPISRDDFGKMSLAYAITVHKSQGSEKEEVHIMLPNTPTNMLTRRLLYTAVTRAKKKVVIYYIDNALSFSVHNTQRSTVHKHRRFAPHSFSGRKYCREELISFLTC